LRELYDADLGDHALAAVAEWPLTPDLANYLRDELNLTGSGAYFNSGVLLLNLRIMRAEKFSQRLAEFTAQRPWLRLPDQDAFNALAAGRVKFLPRHWNYMAQHLQVPGYPLAMSDVKIIHYAHNRKPWRDARMPLAGAFLRHLTLTEKLLRLPGWSVPVLFYEKIPDADSEGITRKFKCLGLPLFAKWKNKTASAARLFGVKIYARKNRPADGEPAGKGANA
jgi:lipopolysaccharide biosynthesis glycosyltransferase